VRPLTSAKSAADSINRAETAFEVGDQHRRLFQSDRDRKRCSASQKRSTAAMSGMSSSVENKPLAWCCCVALRAGCVVCAAPGCP
jgi:hypothetical protein